MHLRRCLLILTICLTVVPAFADGAAVTTRPADLQPGLPAGTQAIRDANYADSANAAQTLDLLLPPNAERKPLPVVIYFHGGAWEMGSKRPNPVVGLLSLGYAVASVEYRFSQEAPFPAQIYDCKAAVRWLRANAERYHLDKEHFAATGDSAGGHLVALLGTSGDVKELEGAVGKHLDQSSRVQCVVDLYGPTDMAQFKAQAEAGANPPRGDHPYAPIEQLFGGTVEAKADLVRLANPITFVNAKTPPFLILHGDKDSVVPVAQSEILDAALAKAGVEHHLEVIHGAGHGGPAFAAGQNLAMVVGFLERHLKAAK